MSAETRALFYKSRKNMIFDSTGKQIAVILPVNCTKQTANSMAAYVAQQMNHEQRDKARGQQSNAQDQPREASAGAKG